MLNLIAVPIDLILCLRRYKASEGDARAAGGTVQAGEAVIRRPVRAGGIPAHSSQLKIATFETKGWTGLSSVSDQ
jgi:hypothetical protein